MECELCDREMKNLTVHHLIPKQHTKRKNLEISSTIDICSACHRQIHVLFDNKRLAKELNTIEALKTEPQMRKFLAWVRKQNPQKRITVHRQK
ncbi:MAG: HNH endonuclease [Xenococcaceae cyanobacterium]